MERVYFEEGRKVVSRANCDVTISFGVVEVCHVGKSTISDLVASVALAGAKALGLTKIP